MTHQDNRMVLFVLDRFVTFGSVIFIDLFSFSIVFKYFLLHLYPLVYQVTEEVYYPMRNMYQFECRGAVAVKGKGTMTTYKLFGRKTRAPPSTPPNYQNIMLPAMYQLPHGQIGHRGSIADSNIHTIPRHPQASFFFPPTQEDETVALYAMSKKYNCNISPHGSIITHATPPGSMGHRRKFSGGHPPVSYSDAMIGSKAGQLVSKMSTHSLQNAPVGIINNGGESPELPAIHYRKLYIKGSGSGSLSRQPVDDVDVLENKQMLEYPPTTLTQSQINGKRSETEGEYNASLSEEEVIMDLSADLCSPITMSSMSPTHLTHTPLSDSAGMNLSQSSSRHTTPNTSRRTTPNTSPHPTIILPQSPSRNHYPVVTHQQHQHRSYNSPHPAQTNNFSQDHSHTGMPSRIYPSPGLGMPGTALTQIRENPMFVCESTTEDESNSPPCLAGDASYSILSGNGQAGNSIPPSKNDLLQLNDIMKALGHPDQMVSVSPFPTSSGASTPSSWRGPHFPQNARYSGGRKRNVPITVPRSSHNNSLDSAGSNSPLPMYDIFNGYSIEDYMLPNTSDGRDKSSSQHSRTHSEQSTVSAPPITNRPFPGELQKQNSLPEYLTNDLQQAENVAVDQYGTMPTSLSLHSEINNTYLINEQLHVDNLLLNRRPRDSVSSNKSSSSGSGSGMTNRHSNSSPPPLLTPPISEHSQDNISMRDSRNNLIGPLSVSEPVQREAVRQCLMNGENDQNGINEQDKQTSEEDGYDKLLKPSESSAFSAVVPQPYGLKLRNKCQDNKCVISICSENSQNGSTSHTSSGSDDRASVETDSSHRKSGKNRLEAPPFQIKRRQKHNAPRRLCRSLDYIPSDLEDVLSNVSSRAESPLIPPLQKLHPSSNNHQPHQNPIGPPFPTLGSNNHTGAAYGARFSPISLVRRMIAADNISLSSVCSSEMSRSDPALNYDSAGSSAAYESEYDNYRPGMASDEDYFAPEPISDMDIDAFDDINVDSVTVSDSYGMDMPFAMRQQKKITDV